MIPTLRSPESDPEARGHAFGAVMAPTLHRSWAGYAEVFALWGATGAQVRDWGSRAFAATVDWAPELGAEMDGIAAGAGLARWQVGALNGRTELLAALSTTGEGECSTSVVLAPGGPRTVQTWDWHDTLRDGMVLWSIQERVLTFTEAGIVGKIGLNSAGLGVHFNVLRHASDSAEIGVPVHVVARRILDEAATLDEATAIARSARLSASTLITVVTADGVRGLELSPAGVGVVDASDGVYLHTNHFLDASLARGERVLAGESTTSERLRWLASHTDGLGAADRGERAAALCAHDVDGAAVCAHPDMTLPAHQRWETLATISLDVVGHRMAVHRGGPCTVGTWQEASTHRDGRGAGVGQECHIPVL